MANVSKAATKAIMEASRVGGGMVDAMAWSEKSGSIRPWRSVGKAHIMIFRKPIELDLTSGESRLSL